MTARDRVFAAIRGEKPDRVPFCFWYHFSPDPAAGPDSKMAELELDFYRRYRPDILKVMHDIDFEPIPPIETAADWAKIPILDPAKGNFGKQLHTLAQIRAGLAPDVPMISTVFGVYHYAEHLSDGRLLAHLREDAGAVRAGLERLAESLSAFARAIIAGGSEGIYYAIQGASAAGATRDEYEASFLGLDRQVLGAVGNSPLNIIHLHGYNDLYFDLVKDLPAAAICWADVAAGPSIAQARRMHSGCLMGGVDETQFTNMTRAQIVAQARAAIADAGDTRFILGPGCSIPTDSDPDLIGAFREAVEGA